MTNKPPSDGMRLFRRLVNPQQGYQVLLALWPELKNLLLAGHVLELIVKPETRTGEQNAKFHAICSDLARSQFRWGGKPRDAAAWKTLLVSGHAVATGEGLDILPGIESEFVNLRESTALMSKRRGSSLIEYAHAFCALNGVELHDVYEHPQAR